MFALLLLFGGVGLVAAAAGSGSATSERPIPPVDTSDPLKINALEIALWESSGNVPASKMNNRGFKFIDPYAIEGACWTATSDSVKTLQTLRNSPAAVARYMHTSAQSTPPKAMPAADVLINMAANAGSAALGVYKNDLRAQVRWWTDKIKQYARYTQNGYVIAAAELYAFLVNLMPAEWYAVYKRAEQIAVGEADALKAALTTTIGFGLPMPLHILDGSIASLDDLRFRASVLSSNLRKYLALPLSAKRLLQAWNAVFVAHLDDDDVKRAVTWVDNHDWGVKNLASDEQVYLIGLVLAKSAGLDPVTFVADLWERARGWSRFKGLATNNHLSYLRTSGGGSIYYPTTNAKDAIEFDQPQLRSLLGTWNPNTAENEMGGYDAAECITNARMLNQLEITLTAFELLSEKTGALSPIDRRLVRPVLVL